jgi:hypothetical protein
MKDFLKRLSQFIGGLGIIMIGALLGAIGGQKWRWLRRFVYPAIITIYALAVVQNWWCTTIYCISGFLSIGYGLVSPDDDKPSFLGKMAYKLFPNSHILQNMFARGLIGLGISLSMLSIPILKGDWLHFILGSIMIIGVWAFISWRGMGELPVKLFGKVVNLLWVDIICYGTTTCGILEIINQNVGWMSGRF